MKDLIVVGAGPAGSVCAMHAAKAGLDVLLLDRKTFPRTKSCGGALSRRTMDNLGARGKSGVNCSGNGLVVYSPSLQQADYEEEDALYLVVRKHWDHQLALDAEDAGAEWLDGTAVSNVSTTARGVRVDLKNKDNFKAKYAVIADGTGLRTYKKRLGFQQPYDHMAKTVCVETPMEDSRIDDCLGKKRKLHIFFGIVPRGYGWVFPKHGYLNVGIGYSNGTRANLKQLEVFDRFVALLRNEDIIPEDFDVSNRISHPIPFKKPFHPTGKKNILLAGDAGGFVSPVTGEGLYYGTSSGRIAAEVIYEHLNDAHSTDLADDYQNRWMNLFGYDLIKKGLPLANLVYKSRWRMERLVRMMSVDEPTKRAASQMIMGLANYGETRSRIIKRAPLSILKSL